MNTRVHTGAMCNSACPLLWLAGLFRHLDNWAFLGFHTASWRPKDANDEPGTRVRYERGNDLVGRE